MYLLTEGYKPQKTHILAYVPTPPPYAGPEIGSNMLLKACREQKIRTTHVRSNVRDENWKKGNFDLEGVLSFLKVYYKFLLQLFKSKPDKVYFLLSSSRAGFVRDAVIIFTSKLLLKKNIAHYRGGNFHNFYKQQGNIFRWLIRHTLKRIDCIIVQAEILKKMFDDLFPKGKIHVLYNGLQSEDLTPICHAKREKPFTILFMGHVAFSKGFYELAQAVKRLSRKQQIRFLFAGAKRYSAKKRKSIRNFLSGEARGYFDEHSNEIGEIISEFIGDADNYNARDLGIISGKKKAEAFAEADVFVLPSYTEGFSMAVLEAMSYGLPVIVTPVGAFPEVVKEGVNGFFVEPGNADDLEAKIESLIRDPEKARRMGEYNKEYVSKRFSIDRIALEFETILANT